MHLSSSYNSGTKVNYKTFLAYFLKQFVNTPSQLGWFDSRQVSAGFKALANNVQVINVGSSYPVASFEVKRISADLDRFYRMGFLKRRRAKRIITRPDGRTVTRGWKYDYAVTNQGWKYTRYLIPRILESKEDKLDEKNSQLWEVDDPTIQKFSLGSLSPEDAASEIVREKERRHVPAEFGIYGRYPRVYCRELFLKYIAARIGSNRNYLETIAIFNQARKQNKELSGAKDDVIEFYKTQATGSGFSFLKRATSYFVVNNINPPIRPNIPVSAATPDGVPLLLLLRAIEDELRKKGFE
jgi:hypothetical protein